MIKLLGAVIIIMTGVTLGFMPLLDMKERVRMITMYREGLNRMKSELSTYGTSIPLLMNHLRAIENSCKLFAYVSDAIEQNGPMCFSSAWHTYITEHGKFLNNTECETMCTLGEVLGRYSLEEQIASIDRSIELLASGAQVTRVKLQELSRIYIGTSLCLSTMLVVLLL